MNKKKIVVIIVTIVILGICGTLGFIFLNKDPKETKSNNTSLNNNLYPSVLKEYLTNINNENYIDAVSLMNTDVLKNKYDIDLDNEEIVTGLKKINEDEQSIEYDLNSIQKIDKQNLDSVLEASDLTEYKSLFAEKFSDYDFYSVSLKIKYEDEIVEKLNDILMIKPDGTFAGSMVINSVILYYNVSTNNSVTTKDKEGIVVGDYNLTCGTYIAEFPPMGDGSEDTMKGTLTIYSDYTFTLKTEGYSDTDFLNKESDNCKGIFKIEYDVKEESGLSFDYLTFIPDDNSPSFSLRVNADNLLGDDWHQYRYQE